MHSPPPVSLAVTRGWRWRALQAVLAGCAAAVLAGWLGGHLGINPSWRAAGVAGSAVLACALGWRQALSPAGMLAWTGASWRWTAADGAAAPRETRAPRVAFDLGRAMLLRLDPLDGGAPLWIASTRPSDALQWAAFRAAVYSPAPRTGMRSPDERRIP